MNFLRHSQQESSKWPKLWVSSLFSPDGGASNHKYQGGTPHVIPLVSSYSSLSLFLDNLINCLSSFCRALEETIPWLSFWSSSFCLFILPGGLIQSGSSTSGYNVEGCEKDFPPLITAKGNKDKLKLQIF